MNTAEIVCLAFWAGYLVGWLLNRKPPVIQSPKVEANLTIDPALLHKINCHMVTAWLDQHGMVWQPKGAVFDPKREVKK